MDLRRISLITGIYHFETTIRGVLRDKQGSCAKYIKCKSKRFTIRVHALTVPVASLADGGFGGVSRAFLLGAITRNRVCSYEGKRF